MEISFAENYNDSNLILIEMPSHILDEINTSDGEIYIKGEDKSFLCTKSKSYEIRYSETSNTLLITKPSKKISNSMILETTSENSNNIDIIQTLSHTLDLSEILPKRNFIIKQIKKSGEFQYDLLSSGESNKDTMKSPVSINDIFSKSPLSIKDIQTYLRYFNTFSIEGNVYVFELKFIFEILKDMIFVLSKEEIDHSSFTLAEIYENPTFISSNRFYSKIFSDMNISQKTSCLNYICSYVDQTCDHDRGFPYMVDQNTRFSIDTNKMKYFLALNIFENKTTFNLKDFNEVLTKLYSISFPSKLLLRIKEAEENYLSSLEESSDNIFEFYNDKDLRFLKGKATLLFLKTQREVSIKFIDETDLSETFEERLNELFKIKEKWTLNELSAFLNFDASYNEKIPRYCKQFSEANPFDKTRQVVYYRLKFSL